MAEPPAPVLDHLRSLWRALLPRVVRHGAGRILRPFALAYTLRAAATAKDTPGQGLPALVGSFSGASGIALSVQLASQALDHLGIDHRRIDVRDVATPTDPGDPSASVWFFYLNAPEMLWLMFRWGPRRLRGPRYGYWAWELERAPTSWRRIAVALNGVITPSHFTTHSLRGARGPVTTTPHPIFAEDFERVSRPAECALGGIFRVVCLFDFKSSFARKNPFAALEAFKRAFGDDPLARLVFKTHNAAAAPELAERLGAQAGPNVEIVDAIWTHAQILNFVASADALISLHRAEGFGLSLAEAMILETPVVATAWSGNLDFMDEETACLVPVRMIPVDDPQDIYKGQVWADPDVDVAAGHLRLLRDDPVAARAMATRARTRVKHELNPEAWFASLPPALQAALRPA